MKRVAFAAVILMCSLTHLAAAQSLEYVNSTMLDCMTDVKVVGDYAYCAFMNGMQILDVAHPEQIPPPGEVGFRGDSGRVDVAGNFAYVACSDSGLYVIDVSDFHHPRVVGRYASRARDVVVHDHYAYVTEQNLLILDVADPMNPVQVGSYPHTGEMVIADTLMYLSRTSELEILNLADPADPQTVGECGYPPPWGKPRVIRVVGNLAYVVERDGGSGSGIDSLRILDVHDPANPRQTGACTRIPSGQWRTETVEVYGDRAFVSTPDGIYQVDISDSSQPRVLNTSTFGWTGCPSSNRSFATGSRMYVAKLQCGLGVIDLANHEVGGLYPPWPVEVMSVAMDNNSLFAAEWGMFFVMDLSDSARPTMNASLYTEDGGWRILVKDGLAISAGEHSLDVIDVTDPAHLSELGHCSISSVEVYGIASRENYVYVADVSDLHAEQVEIVDIEDPSNPFVAAAFSTDSHTRMVFANGTELYLSGGTYQHGLTICDLTDPLVPTVVSRIDSSLYVYDVAMVGGYLYALTGNLIQILDVTDPSHPVIAGTFNAAGLGWQPDRIKVAENIACLTQRDAGVLVVDASDPLHPRRIGQIRESASEAYSYGDYVYLWGSYSLDIFRVSPTSATRETDGIPVHFSLAQNYPNPFNATTMITYSLAKAERVELSVYDLLGRHAATLMDGGQLAGEHTVSWNAGEFPSGTYFARLKTGEQTRTIRLTLLK